MAGFAGPGERRLLLVRHGAAGAPPADGGDRDRPLSPEGWRGVEGLAAHLVRNALIADHGLCSPARRTRETLEILLEKQDGTAEGEIAEELYLAPAGTILSSLRRIPAGAGTVLLVGHNPGLQELVVALAGNDAPPASAGFPPATLAVFAVATPWAELGPGATRLIQFRAP
ncbi:MAG TPA: histidine phosphatase family protein [Stellaceae bacterium]|nr:histidine phosphatase family protein [Stellaceae bacterium]